MKLRNFLIVLFAILMVFAFASCKNEPKEEPKPTPKPQPVIPDYYQIEVTEGVDKDYWNRDKIKIEWEEEVNAGDVVSLKYRSERDVYQWDIRDGSLKWVYETKKGSFTDPVLGEDGWWTLTYTFANDINGAAVDSNERFGIYFRGNYVTTDLFEIKDITLNGEPLEITQDNIKSYAVLNDTEDHPLVEHDWSKKNWSVLFATGTVGEVDKTPLAEKVLDGGYVTGAPVNKEGYTLSIFTDADRTTPFDATQPITENKIFYYSYVGVPRALTFVLNGGAFEEGAEVPATVPNGDMLPEIPEPVLATKAFKAWYKDAELTTPWEATDTVTGDLTLYAAYGEPRTVTFDAQNGEAEHATKIVADGNTVKIPEAPTNGTKMFLGWYTDDGVFEVPYVFGTPVEGDFTISAAWVNATDVTLMDGETTIATFKAALDVALAEDNENLAIEDDKIGLVFAGWFDDAEFTTAHNYEDIITGPITLYAKWVEAPLYKLVATHGVAEGLYDYDKFELKYTDETVNAGDVISFRYRSTTEFTFFSVRDAQKWVYENTTATRGMDTYETKEDGWTYVTYTFAAKTYDGTADIPANATWKFHFGSRTILVGDILEIQDLTLNGKPLAVKPSSSYAAPTSEIVEGGSYAWGTRKVTFNTGEADPIDPIDVEFNRAPEMPADPVLEGSAFAGWFTDAEFTKPFDAEAFITEDITLYAKFAASVTVTFDGTDLAPAIIAKGNKVAKPADPAKAENVFGGWYADSEFAAEFDFTAAIEADTTIYAKWVPSWTVTLNYNYGETPETKAIYVGKGEVMAAPAKNPSRVGFFFGGWYNDAEGTVEHDFSAAVTANATIYAKWNAPTKEYKFTGTAEKDRFQYRFKQSSVSFLQDFEAGDVLTYLVKFTPVDGTSTITKFRVRGASSYGGTSDFSDGITTADAGDGWISVVCVFPESATYSETGILMDIRKASGNFAVGDIVEIKGLAFNGKEIVPTSSSSCGAYEGTAPSFEEVTL